MPDHIYYKEGYKYQLQRDYSVYVDIAGFSGGNDFVEIFPSGWLKIKKGYAWDGPSGPAIDTKDFMRGSLVHDALYQLMREGVVAKQMEPFADTILKEICIEDGMNKIRAWWVHLAVTKFGKNYLDHENPVQTAP